MAIITSIGLDHINFLGDTLASIAREKAGVIKPGIAVVSSCGPEEAAAVIRERCAELGAELIETSRIGLLSGVQQSHGHYLFNLSLEADSFASLSSSLRGRFQVENAAAAVAAAWRLGQDAFHIPRSAIASGLQNTSWPGRIERISERPLVLLDGAHNPAAARALAEFVQDELKGRRLRLVYGSMRDKAVGDITGILFPLAEEVYLTQPHLSRAASPDEILAAGRFRPQRLVIEPEPARAVARACQASAKEDVVMIMGSLFLVGAVKRALLDGQLRLPAVAGMLPVVPT